MGILQGIVIRNKKGDWDKAEKYYLKALKIEETVLNGEKIDFAMTYNNLATLYLERNRDNDLDKAEALYFKALSIWEKSWEKVTPRLLWFIAICHPCMKNETI